ncbi:MAG TPA: FkbM family methyltransferase [Aggregatilineales bacterium]|nr:FkbM family methyltransferase [Anaerolineales bacterium]HRE49300.1 FkbM family methyltransferase [Aggregatilineales bacterium]
MPTLLQTVRATLNRLLAPMDFRLERISEITRLRHRYVDNPSIFAQALAGKRAPQVIDIGASVGTTVAYTLAAAPDAEIYAFEPQPALSEALHARFGANPHVHIFSMGVGSQSGTLPFTIAKTHSTSSFLPPSAYGRQALSKHVAPDLHLDVPVITLDSWYESLVNPPAAFDLIKIDTQGYEAHVIQGGTNVLARSTYIILEAAFRPLYEGQPVVGDICQMMRDRAFEIAFVRAGTANQTNGELWEVDILFKRTAAAKG